MAGLQFACAGGGGVSVPDAIGSGSPRGAASTHMTKNKHILLVEDDHALAKVIIDYLGYEGFNVAWAADGDAALDNIKNTVTDLILLDVMLPGRSGFDLIQILRHRRGTPVIMLTALGQKSDRLRGLNLGADDYVTKPFDLEELSARIRVVLRRAAPNVETIRLDDIVIDFRTMVARKGLRTIHLTHREFELLQYLAERQDHVVHRDQLLREVWGFPEMPETRSVDHAVARLRRKIEPDAHSPRFIHTVHGDGYCLTPSGRRAAEVL
jgi:two-component system response regulator VicR